MQRTQLSAWNAHETKTVLQRDAVVRHVFSVIIVGCMRSLWRHLAIETRGVDDPSYRLHPAQLQLCPTIIARHIQALHPQVTAALTSMRASTLFRAADQPAHHARMRSLRCRHVGAYLGSVYRGCANLLARAAGRLVLPGAEVPYVD